MKLEIFSAKRGILILLMSCFFYSSLNSQTSTIVDASENTGLNKQKVYVKLSEVIKEFKAKFGIDVLYEDKLIAGLVVEASTVKQDVSIEQNLMDILSPVSLSFKKIKEKAFLIIKDKNTKPIITTPKTIASVSPIVDRTIAKTSFVETNNNASASQSITTKTLVPDIIISGTVTDEKGNALEGVSVQVKNGSASVISSKDGKYTIRVKDRKAILTFTFVGFIASEKGIGASNTVNVVLKETSQALDDVVVVGYQTIKRKDATGAVSSVVMSDFRKASVASLEESLSGRTAGVQVISQSGQPGDGFQISIRGNNSVTQDNSPLYVIDGFPIEGFNNSFINPAEIESIDILKDASATAIYGARGANGVVIITTKKGKDGPPQVNYQGYYGNSSISKKIPLLNAYEFVKLQLELQPATATNQYLTRGGKALDDYKNIDGVDMQDKVFRNASIMNHYLSVRGGTPSTKYSFSGNIFQQDGVIINSGYKRYQITSSIDQKVSEKIKVGLNISYTSAKTFGTISAQNGQDASSGRAQGSISPSGFLMYNVWGFRPVSGSDQDFTEEIVDPEAITSTLAYNVNPYVQVSNELREKLDESLIVNTALDWNISKRLKFRSTFGINRLKNTLNNFNNSKTSSGNPVTSPNAILVNGSVENRMVDNWSNENTLTYTNTFKKVHSLTALIGFTQQGNESGSGGFRAIQVPNESLGVRGLEEGTLSAMTSTSSLWTLASFLSRINYSYKSRYLFTANFRADGTSRFSEDNKWAYFPSGSFAWRFSEENFIKPLANKVNLTDAKIRFGYGQTGNNRVDDFSYLSRIATSGINNTYSFNNGAPGTSAVISSVGNKNLKWETTSQTNLGLDLAFFNKRLTFTTDVYQKTTSDLLINANLPAISGYASILRNIGKVENKGIEFSLAYQVIDKGAFTWSSSFNISFNQNKILQLSDNQEAITYALGNRIAGATPISISKVNNPIGTFYGYIWDGVYGYNDFVKLANSTYLLKANIPTNGNARAGIQPGDIKFKDLNADGIVNAADNTIIGNPNPKHYGGFSNNFQYKNFDLNVFFQWSYGNEIANVNRIIFEGGGEFPTNLNQYRTIENRWNPISQNASMPNVRPGSSTYSNVFSSRTIEDGSYLRLKTVNLAYNFPGKLLKKAKIRSAQVYLSAQNLLTITNYSGYDPEVSVISNALAPGVDFSSYPRNKTVTVGLNLNF
jgi:TonB-linked SusC/RagA family outer membrane protein